MKPALLKTSRRSRNRCRQTELQVRDVQMVLCPEKAPGLLTPPD